MRLNYESRFVPRILAPKSSTTKRQALSIHVAQQARFDTHLVLP